MMVKGLASTDIEPLRQRYGFNQIQIQEMVSCWSVFVRQWESPLVWLLCLAVVLSFWLGDFHEAIAIGLIITLNVGIGFLQEWRAEKAILLLRNIVPQETKVIRDGKLQLIPARELVPGDWVQLEAGDRVPADGNIKSKANIALDEAILTGESFPVESTEVVNAGTYLVRGTLVFEVKSIGGETEFGKTAGLLAKSSLEETPLQKRLAGLSKQILFFCVGIVFLVIATSLYQGREVWDVVLFGISLLVASVPEGLPVMVSLGLALGVMRMARRHVLVRRLAAVETLGNVSLICTDKTGTLTHGQLELIEVLADDQRECVLTALAVSESSVMSAYGVGDPLEQAISRHARSKYGVHREDIELSNPRTAVVPFDSDTRSMKITRSDGVTYWKGAAEVLWSHLSSGEMARWNELNRHWTEQGFRTLGVAKILLGGEVKFEGLLVFADPPRDEAKAAVADAYRAGIQTLMLTGDQEPTAKAIAASLNIPNFMARVKAGDKLLKVREMKQEGHIVAMTGDGVNDAPALKEAHVGVSMGLRGSEVAREASDIVLLDDNYASLVAAIHEGRGIFSNIRRAIVYLLVGNWAELVLIITASVAGFPLPLIASQLLWINLLTDGFPALVLMLEPADQSLLCQPPRAPAEPLLRGREWLKILVFGSLEGILVFFVFREALIKHGLQTAQTIAFLVLVWSQVLRLLTFAKSLEFWKDAYRFSAQTISICVIVSLGVQSALVHFEVTRNLLSLSDLTFEHWQEVLGYSLLLPVLLACARLWRGRSLF
jgi:Ca2+-transporting ATPase